MWTIEIINFRQDTDDLDLLLWQALWQPLGFPRDIRKSFTLASDTLEIAARANGKIIAGLVANETAPTEVEIRHLAIDPEYQAKGLGRHLVEFLIAEAKSRGYRRIHTIARNTSAGFFRKLGFSSAPGTPPEHPAFTRHGITFELLQISLEP